MNNSAEASSTETDERRRRRDRNIGEYVREEPLTALAFASGVGFILGGGANSRIGRALLTIVGPIALRAAATSFIFGLITGDRDNQIHDRSEAPGESRRNGNHDNGKTDFREPD